MAVNEFYIKKYFATHVVHATVFNFIERPCGTYDINGDIVVVCL